MACASVGCPGHGTTFPPQGFPEGRRACGQQQAASPPSSWVRGAERGTQEWLGLLGLEGGAAWRARGLCQEVCRQHTLIPVTSTAVAFKHIVQRMRSGRGAGAVREPLEGAGGTVCPTPPPLYMRL